MGKLISLEGAFSTGEDWKHDVTPVFDVRTTLLSHPILSLQQCQIQTQLCRSYTQCYHSSCTTR
jgi:hypothetical protein